MITAKAASLQEKYTGKDCTLDGKPAMILGRKRAFAIVAQKVGALRVEFNWFAVERVMSNGGNFVSG